MREFNVQDYGGGDASSVPDSTIAFEKAGRDAYAASAGTIVAPPVPNGYVLRRLLTDAYAQNGGGIRLRKGVSLRGEGTKLLLRDNASFITNRSPKNAAMATITVTGDVHYGDTKLTVDGTSLLGNGSRVHLRIGNSGIGEYAESRYHGLAVVSNVADATHLTLDRPVLADMTVANTTASCRMLVILDEVLEGVRIEGFDLINDIANGGNTEAGIDLSTAREIELSQIRAADPGAGVALLQFCEGIYGEGLDCRSSIKQANHPSKGRVLTLSSTSRSSFDTVTGDAFEGSPIFAEFFSEDVQISNLTLRNTSPVRDNARAFFLNQTSVMAIDGLSLQGYGAPVVEDGGVTRNYGISSTLRLRNVNARLIPPFTWPTSLLVDGYKRIYTASGW